MQSTSFREYVFQVPILLLGIILIEIQYSNIWKYRFFYIVSKVAVVFCKVMLSTFVYSNAHYTSTVYGYMFYVYWNRFNVNTQWQRFCGGFLKFQNFEKQQHSEHHIPIDRCTEDNAAKMGQWVI